MSGLHSDPPRWDDRTDQCALAERRAGHAVRCVRAVPPRPAPPLAQVSAQLHAMRPRRRFAWILAAATFLLGVATAASAAHLDLLPGWLSRIVRPGSTAPTRENGRPPRARARVAAAASSTPPILPSTRSGPVVAQDAPDPSPTRKVAMVAHEHRPPRAVPAAAVPTTLPTPNAPARLLANPASAIPVAPESSTPVTRPPTPEAPHSPLFRPSGTSGTLGPVLGGPSPPAPTSPQQRTSPATYLTQAIYSLRVERAPGEALRLLDSYDRDLAKGGLEHEALLLRVEALLALGHRAELLRLLDRTSLTDVAASRALLVTRGELRAAASRCADAIGDFDLVLARSRQTDRQALIGRARCRKKLGDGAGSRADIDRLRRDFPDQALPGDFQN